MKTFLLLFVAIGFTVCDKLDRRYLPPPGSKLAGGSPGAIQTPLEFPKETYTGFRQDFPVIIGGDFPSDITAENIKHNVGINQRPGTPKISGPPQNFIPGLPVNNAPFSHFQNNIPTHKYNLPSTTTSYAFSQTTTFPTPISGHETIPSFFSPTSSSHPTNIQQGNINFSPPIIRGQSQPIISQPRPGPMQDGVVNHNLQMDKQQQSLTKSSKPFSQQHQPQISQQITNISPTSKPERPKFNGQSPIIKSQIVPENAPIDYRASQNLDFNQYQPKGRPTLQDVQSNSYVSNVPSKHKQDLKYSRPHRPMKNDSQQNLYSFPQTITSDNLDQKLGNDFDSRISSPNLTVKDMPGKNVMNGHIVATPGKSQQYLIGSTNSPTTPSGQLGVSDFHSTSPDNLALNLTKGFIPSPTKSYPRVTSFSSSLKEDYIRRERPQAESDRNAIIINYDNIITPEGFAYSFDTSNGIHADESGTTTDGVRAQGSYSYTGDDGKIYNIIYTADENGFQPRGDHLPTPPPIPEAILKVIQQNVMEEDAGIIDDGSYDETKYGYKKYQNTMDLYQPKVKESDNNGYNRQLYTKNKSELRNGSRRPIIVTKDTDIDFKQNSKQFGSDDFNKKILNGISTVLPKERLTGHRKDDAVSPNNREIITKAKDPTRRPIPELNTKIQMYADSLDKEYEHILDNTDDFANTQDQNNYRIRPSKPGTLRPNIYNQVKYDSLQGQRDSNKYKQDDDDEANKPIVISKYSNSKQKPQSNNELFADKHRYQFSNLRPKESSTIKYNQSEIHLSDPAFVTKADSIYHTHKTPSENNHDQKIISQPNKQKLQSTKDKEFGYQYIPPQNKLKQGETNKYPLRIYSQDEIPATKISSEQQEDKTVTPFMTINVARDNDSTDLNLYSPSTDKSTMYDEVIDDIEDNEYHQEKKPSKIIYGDKVINEGIAGFTSTERPFNSPTQLNPRYDSDQSLAYKGTTNHVQGNEDVYHDEKDRPKSSSYPFVSSTTPMPSQTLRFSTTPVYQDDDSTQIPLKSVHLTTRIPFNVYTDRTVETTRHGSNMNTPSIILDTDTKPIKSTVPTYGYSHESNTDSRKHYEQDSNKPTSTVTSPSISGASYSGETPEVTSKSEYIQSHIPSSTYRPQIDVTKIIDNITPVNIHTIPSQTFSDVLVDGILPSTTYRPNYSLPSRESEEPSVIYDAFGRVISNPEQIQGFPGKTVQPIAFTDHTTRLPNTGEQNLKYKSPEINGQMFDHLKPTAPGFRLVPSQGTTSYAGLLNEPKVIGEDFSGPKQPQRYDPETGYHYK